MRTILIDNCHEIHSTRRNIRTNNSGMDLPYDIEDISWLMHPKVSRLFAFVPRVGVCHKLQTTGKIIKLLSQVTANS